MNTLSTAEVEYGFFTKVRRLSRSRDGVAATLQTLTANLFIIGINIATGVITARLLGPAGRGEQAATLMWPQFFASTMSLGLPASLIYNSKKYPEDANRLYSAALLMGAVLGMLAALIGLFIIPHWLVQYSQPVVRFAQWTMILVPVGVLAEISSAAFRAREEFHLYNSTRFLPPLFILTGLLLLALTHTVTPITAALIGHIGCTLVSVWVIAHHLRALRPQWRGLRNARRRLLSYGLRIYGSDLLVTLSLQIDQVLVVGFLDPLQMGIYIVALSLSRMLNVFQTAVVYVLFPKMAGRSAAEVVGMTGRAVRVSTALTVVVGIVLVLLARPALTLVYGPEFGGATRVLLILVMEAIINGAVSILLQAFMSLEKPGVVTFLQAVGLSLTLPLLLILIPTYGVVGAGLALLTSTICRFLLVLVSYPLFLKQHPPGLLLNGRDLNFLRLAAKR